MVLRDLLDAMKVVVRVGWMVEQSDEHLVAVMAARKAVPLVA